ncbi:MAG: hypothetical protein WC869_01095 [Phycisphaerae bacterium]|jgi:hypothetical protein
MTEKKHISTEGLAAKVYTILDRKLPSLDKCWSACNGIDAFGHRDSQMEAVRKKRGECFETLPCRPRLILYREKPHNWLGAKLWTTRTFDAATDDRLLLASLAKALLGLGLCSRLFHIELIDWAPDKPCDNGHDFDGRYELSIEVAGLYSMLPELKQTHKNFFKIFDNGKWT